MAATSRTASRLDLAFQSSGKTCRILQNPSPIRPPRAFWRTGDNGVDLFGVKGAPTSALDRITV